MAELRLNDLAVGQDGRNRIILSAFRSRTGRNQPSQFQVHIWPRRSGCADLIKPPPGHAVAYVDWKQQEFGIAAALSGDTAMQAAYLSGDPYLAFAKQAAAVPAAPPKRRTARSASCSSSASSRCSMAWRRTAWRYALGNRALLRAICCAHHETYRTFWRWSDAALDHAMLTGSLHTVFGWHIHIGEKPNPSCCEIFQCKRTAPK